MSSDLAIRVEGLGKAYTVRHRRHDHVTLAQTALERLKHPLQRDEREEFWALRDVSFEVKQGEVLGIIGQNGSGKSTLLKVLTRITAPTNGRVKLWGRVGSLLEVGTGFHPELTGRENIYLNGSIIGMRRQEIDRQFDAIVDFAGVEKFLDTPVKRYSSGMYVRLAFAVAAHMQTEILLLDEVLAVGDAEFQRRCLERIRSVAGDGRSVLLVSHDISRINSICGSCLLLDAGRAVDFGKAPAVTERYQRESSESPPRSLRPLAKMFDIELISQPDPTAGPSSQREISFTVEAKEYTEPFFISVVIVDEYNVGVAHCDSRMWDQWLDPTNVHRVTLRLKSPWLHSGRYRADLFVCNSGVLEHIEGISRFSVSNETPYARPIDREATSGAPVLADFEYQINKVSGPDEEPPMEDVPHESLL